MDSAITILQILGALGIFIYGMKMMSEGLQKVAGNKMRAILKGMTKNRFLGILTGLGITVLIQSSSATTVMVVSFVNAGLLSLTESFGVVMGANIGTTITAWILAIFGFKVKIKSVAIILIGVFFPFMFSSKDKLKHTAEFVLGFGILFIGLGLLKDSVPNPGENPLFESFVNGIANWDFKYASILVFIIIGTLLTVVVQSSSAATAITLTLLASELITFELACAMVLGENIGTTVTANIAAAVGNVHGKRTARFHFLFNVIGVVWILVLFFPFTEFIFNSTSSIYNWVTGIFGSGVIENKDSVLNSQKLMSMALFHTAFNVLNVIILFALVPTLGKWVIKMVPSTSDDDEEFKLQHISTGLMATPALSIIEAKKEINQFAKLVDKMANNVYDLFFEKQKNVNKLIDKIRDREDMTDRMDLELNDFLAKVSESDTSKSTSNKIQQMLSMSGDLERIADIYFEITKSFERLKREEVELPANAKEELKDMMKLVMQALKHMRNNLKEDNEQVDLETVIALEREINAKRKQIFTNHFSRLEKGTYTPKQGVLFIDFVNRCERIGDHILNVHEAIQGKSDLYSEVD